MSSSSGNGVLHQKRDEYHKSSPCFTQIARMPNAYQVFLSSQRAVGKNMCLGEQYEGTSSTKIERFFSFHFTAGDVRSSISARQGSLNLLQIGTVVRSEKLTTYIENCGGQEKRS